MLFAVFFADCQMLGCVLKQYRNFRHGSSILQRSPCDLQVVVANTENAAANWRVHGLDCVPFECSASSLGSSETFRKLGVPYFGVLIIRNLLLRVQY